MAENVQLLIIHKDSMGQYATLLNEFIAINVDKCGEGEINFQR